MQKIDKSAPVLVTGATGYVAGWVVKRLLEEGLQVHAAVRDPGNRAKIAHLEKLAATNNGSIKFFKADLLEEGSYDEAMQGCKTVFHTASPFTIAVNDPQKELIDPAVNGTMNVLEAANRTQSVQNVVLTSSCAAIYGDNSDCAKAPGGMLTEQVWNNTSSLSNNAYSYSKTLAERAAWEIAEIQGRWKLVVVNPGLVIGPALQDNPTSESFNMVKQMGDGTLKSGAPRWGFGVVDVRDLAEAHLAAAFDEDANGRNIIVGHESDLFELSQHLKDKFGADYPLPKSAAAKWLVWLVAPFLGNGMTRKTVSENINVPWRADNSKAVKELGMDYRPLKQSMEDMFEQMIHSGAFQKQAA